MTTVQNETTPHPEGASKEGGPVRPILFSAPMVRALLAGTKTQTRRIAKAKRGTVLADFTVNAGQVGIATKWELPLDKLAIPHAVGDRLWVREGLGREVASFLGIQATNGTENAIYSADGAEVLNEHEFNLCPWWRSKTLPSIHMPRWASRLTLTVTDVRVQRLQEISDDDAAAEGWPAKEARATAGLAEIRDAYPVGWYAWLWDSINGAGSWEANPWVVAYTFTVARQNIDAALSLAQGDRT